MITPVTLRDPLESMNSYLVASNYFKPTPVKVVPPVIELLSNVRYPDALMRFLEQVTRTADKSEIAAGPHSHHELMEQIISQKTEFALEHASGLEHLSMTFRIQASHDVTQELARQFSASNTQATTRYVSFSEQPPEAVLPWHLLGYNTPEMAQHWVKGMESAFAHYQEAVERFGWQPHEARSFLPNDAKTEIVTTMNIRGWREFLSLRCSSEAQPDMQVVARELLRILTLKLPTLFQDIQDRVNSLVGEKDAWLEQSEGEVTAREQRTYGQWRDTVPVTPRPGQTNPKLDPSKDFWIPYADAKNRPDLQEFWCFKLLSGLVTP